MFKFTNIDDTKKNLTTTKLIITENLALDGAELIPVDCGGRLIAPTISVNELGKQLLKAAAEGNVDKTKSLLNRGALFTADWLGASPLHLAARNNHYEVCEILLRAGISRDARTKVDKTPLHMAAYEGHVSIVEILLEYNADPSCRDLLGMTPLHWAAQNGHLDVVKVLLKRCLETDPVNKFDLTPADLAAQINRLDIVEVLNLSEKNKQIPDPLSYRLSTENSNESDYQQNAEQISPSTSNSPIPLETILMEEEEENENSIDSDALNLSKDEQDQQQHHHSNIFAESMKLLQEHGITMLTNDDTNILTTVMETGHSVVLTDVGKEVLNSMKESEKKQFDDSLLTQKKKIITVTPEELLAMTTTNSTANRTNLFKQINRAKSPKNNIKRIVMKKNKVIPISNTMFKSHKIPSSTDMETVMRQLIEARKTIEEYKVKLLKKEQEAERYKQQLKLLMDES